MRHLHAFSLLLLLLVMVPALSASTDGSIGLIKEVTGTATVTRGGTEIPAEIGAPVFQNDLLETELESTLGVVFVDETRISLGADASLAIDEYVFSPQEDEGSFFTRLGRGSVLFVSGLIAKMGPETSKVETPVGTIGIRGTKFIVGLEEVPAEPGQGR